jgi:mannose-1-phosphate guanylyltransferase
LLIGCYSCHNKISGSRAVKISPLITIDGALTPPEKFIQVVTRAHSTKIDEYLATIWIIDKELEAGYGYAYFL